MSYPLASTIIVGVKADVQASNLYVPPPPTEAIRIGVFPPPRITRRIPLTVQGLLTAPLIVAELTYNCLLVCELAEQLVVQGLIEASLLSQIREYIRMQGELGVPLTESMVAVAELGREIREKLLVEGKIPLFEILNFIKRLEDVTENGME